MKLKAKLISTIAAFAMVLCLTIVGVWAAATVTVTVTGNVSFSPTDVNVRVQGSITGIAETGKTYDKTFNDETPDEQANDTWALENITFVKHQDVVITLKVTNLDSTRSFKATLANSGSGTNTTAALGTTTEPTIEGTTATATINAGQTETFTFTIHVTDWNKAAGYNINLLLTLAKAD